MTQKKKETTAQSEKLIANPVATFKAMGDDLVVVNELKDNVVVLNESARVILKGIIHGDSPSQIVSMLEESYLFEVDEEKVDLAQDVDRVRTELVDAGVLVRPRPYVSPTINVRNLSTALEDTDLGRAEVSQVE